MTGARRRLWWAPNALTLLRLALAPVLFGVLIAAWPSCGLGAGAAGCGAAITPAGVLFLLAGLFDFLDGRLARAWGVESRFGELWDPIADKAVIGAALAGLAALAPVLAPAAAAIILRDVGVTALRLTPRGARVRTPSGLAKAKTALEFVGVAGVLFASLPLLAAGPATPPPQGAVQASNALFWASAAGVYVAAALSVWTGAAYARAVVKGRAANAPSPAR